MSQHDLSIANQGFPAFRSDLNDALQALVSLSSGTSAPSTTYANQLWYDTTNNIVKMRNEDNDAWITLLTLNQSTDVVSGIGDLTLSEIPSTSDSLTFTANQIIQVTDNTNAALRITQLGTGKALLVEDSSNPDSSPFVIDASGNVGIGTSSPTNTLQVAGTVKASSQLYVGSNSDDSYSGGIQNLSNSTRSIGIHADPTNAGANSVITFNVDGTQRGEFDSSGNFKFNSGYGSVATAYGCRAWVNFNGSGTIAIRGSGNVSSITDVGVANYTVNFSTSMPDANYCLSGMSGNNDTSLECVVQNYNTSAPATGSVRVRAARIDGTMDVDPPIMCVSIFR